MTGGVPSVVYLDTSVAVAAMFPGLAYFAPSQAFCEELETAESHVVFSEILRLELSQVIVRLPRDPMLPADVRQQFRLSEWDASAAIRAAWLFEGIRRFDALVNRFAVTTEVAFNRDLWLASVTIMARHRLRSHDAIHVATARSVDVRAFVTLDSDFRRVPDLDVHLLREPVP